MTQNLLGFSQPQLEGFFSQLGEKPFRARQLMKWIYRQEVTDFADMTDLSKSLRVRLTQCAKIQPPKIVHQHVSTDGTYKWLVELEDGNRIETVYIPEERRGTLCISSQVGCSLDCAFCSTGKQGYSRHLRADEIIGQLYLAYHALNQISPDSAHRLITNVVMMGMGEPLLNLDHVLPCLEIMTNQLAYGLSKRRVTVSTAGVIPGIERLAEMQPVSLAVSLHAPNDDLRTQLVPINKKYPIEKLMSACQSYSELGPRQKITFEYVLLKGINDTPQHGRQLIELMKQVPSKVNLIPFNSFPNSEFERPSKKEVARFFSQLNGAGVLTTVRRTRGDDIDAACGQLVGNFMDRTRRSAKYLQIQQGSLV